LANNRIKFELYRSNYFIIGKDIIVVEREKIGEIFRKKFRR
jgi:hypothetical protein